MCFIRNLLRIVKRFIRLVGADPDKPLCICHDALGKLKYITSNDINYVFVVPPPQFSTSSALLLPTPRVWPFGLPTPCALVPVSFSMLWDSLMSKSCGFSAGPLTLS
jgi:hypothetical protein